MDIRITTVHAFPAEGGVIPAAKLIKRSCVLPSSPGALSTLAPALSGARRLTRLAIGCLLVLAVLLCLPLTAAAQRPAFFGYYKSHIMNHDGQGICDVDGDYTNAIWLSFSTEVNQQTGHYQIVDDINTAASCTKPKQVVVDLHWYLFKTKVGDNGIGKYDFWVAPSYGETETQRASDIDDLVETVHTVLSQLSVLGSRVIALHVYDEPFWHWWITSHEYFVEWEAAHPNDPVHDCDLDHHVDSDENHPEYELWPSKAQFSAELELVTAELQDQFPTTPLWLNFSYKELQTDSGAYLYEVPTGIDYLSFDCYGGYGTTANYCGDGNHGISDYANGLSGHVTGLRQLTAGHPGMKLVIIPPGHILIENDASCTTGITSGWVFWLTQYHTDWYLYYFGRTGRWENEPQPEDVVGFFPYAWPTFHEQNNLCQYGPGGHDGGQRSEAQQSLAAIWHNAAAIWTNYWVDGGATHQHGAIATPSNNATFTDSLQVTGYAVDLAFAGQVPWTSGMDYVDVWLVPQNGQGEGRNWFLSSNWMYQQTTYGLDSSTAAGLFGEPFRYSGFNIPHTTAQHQRADESLENPVALSTIPNGAYTLLVGARSLVDRNPGGFEWILLSPNVQNITVIKQ